MKKIVFVVLAMIVVSAGAVIPANAKESIVEQAAAEAIAAAMEAMPAKAQTLARMAFWIGNESGCSATTDEVSAAFESAMTHIDLPEEQKSFIEASFRLGVASATAELREEGGGACSASILGDEDDGDQEKQSFCNETGDCFSVVVVE